MLGSQRWTTSLGRDRRQKCKHGETRLVRRLPGTAPGLSNVAGHVKHSLETPFPTHQLRPALASRVPPAGDDGSRTSNWASAWSVERIGPYPQTADATTSNPTPTSILRGNKSSPQGIRRGERPGFKLHSLAAPSGQTVGSKCLILIRRPSTSTWDRTGTGTANRQ